MKRFVIVLGVILGLILVVAVIAFFGVGFYLSPQSRLTKSDEIVAISGGDTQERTAEAVRLYRAGWAPHIIFSGAALDPNGPSNARAMANDAESQGVPESAISLDEASTDTRENATNVAAIIKDRGDHSLILVTSPYHQRRAAIVFHRALPQGVAIVNHSSLDPGWRRSDWWATPSSRSLTVSELQKVIYELAGGK
jgi:uncharacterized SAM-binding protein YcdF (DUF218 family)